MTDLQQAQSRLDAAYESMPFVTMSRIAVICAKGGIPLNQCGPSSGIAREAFETAYNSVEGEEK